MLGDCHASVLQRIIDRSDCEDLFLLRQVSRRFRDAVNARVRRAAPDCIPISLGGASFPVLQSLSLEECPRGDYSWLAGELARLPRLQELLHLVPGDIDPASDDVAPALGRLTRLSLRSSQSENVCSDFLCSLAARCTSLQRLQLCDGRLSWESLHEVAARLGSTLTELDLTHVSLPESLPQQAFQALSTRKLRTLRLRTFRLFDEANPRIIEDRLPEALEIQLATFTGLTALDLRDMFNMVGAVGCLNALTGLTQLSLAHAAGWRDVGALTRLTGLLDLDVSGTDSFDDTDDEDAFYPRDALAGFPSLTMLDVSGCSLRPDFSLAAQPILCGLVAKCCILSELAPALADLPQLGGLQLAGASCTAADLCCLSGLTGLGLLDLTDICIRPPPMAGKRRTDLEWLAGLTALTSLSLAGKDTMLTRGALQRLAQLRTLDLRVASLEQPAELALLERLPLAWLRLPETYKAADQLPPGLAVPFLKGLEQDYDTRMSRLYGG